MPYIDLGAVVGPQGEQGATGAQGIRGEQGLPGPNQVTNSTATPLAGVLVGKNGVVGVESIDDVPTQNSTGFATSGGVKTALDTKANQPQLAYVETGTTASRNYTEGQYISLNGLLYTADTTIASGATFYTSGGNKNLTECVEGGLNSNSIHRAAIPLYNASSLFTLERGFGIAKFYGGNNGTTAVLTRTEQGSSKSRTISVGASSWENIPVVAGDTITYYGGANSNGEIYYIGHHIGQ